MASFDYEVERLALQADANLNGGWETAQEDWIAGMLGNAVRQCVPQGWGRICVGELLGIRWPDHLKDLPRGPAWALLGRLYPKWMDGPHERWGAPPRDLGLFLMQTAYYQIVDQISINVPAAD